MSENSVEVPAMIDTSPPTPFSHSVRISQSAKGARVELVEETLSDE